jgi:hypothetical protein
MVCEMCNMYRARYEAIVVVGTSYKTLALCSMCATADNVITHPVKMLDTNLHGG